MKKVLIIGIVVLVVGAALFGGGWYLSGGHLSVLNSNLGPLEVRFGDRDGFVGVRGQQTVEVDPAEKRYDFSATGVEKLVVVERNSPLRVTVSPDRQIHLLCRESEGYGFELTNDGGVLRLERTERKPLPIRLFDSDQVGESVLQLPAGLGGEIELSCKNDRVTLSALRLDGQGTLLAYSENGRVEAEDISAGGVTLKSRNGRVEAEGVSAALLTAESQNGSVTLSGCAADVSIRADSDNGSIEVDGISAGQSIRLASSNGSVRGTLPGSMSDYTVESRASNGSNSLPERYGRGDVELHVTSSNGGIKLKFAED